MGTLTGRDLDDIRDQLTCAVEEAQADPDGWAAVFARDAGRLFGEVLTLRAERDQARDLARTLKKALTRQGERR